MTDRPSHNLDGLDIDLARRIDEVCRRFEADWRAGARHPLEDYLAEVPGEPTPHSGRNWRPWSTSCARRRRPSHPPGPALPRLRGPGGTESLHDRRGSDDRPWTAEDPYRG